MKKNKNIILGVCGGIAAYKVCDLIRLLKKENYEVTCLMTEEAAKFITPHTLQYLSGNKVYLDLFDLPKRMDPAHVSLAAKAGLIVVIPATAHMIAKLSGGLADCILSCTVLASCAPILICPAMHEDMYKKEVVQENIKILKKRNFKFAGPRKGRLLSGEEGFGHLESLDEIFKKIKNLLT
jgi:phosphopantothenoylcysteine decarboxylase / phosphopantothenate---cysteine ligase